MRNKCQMGEKKMKGKQRTVLKKEYPCLFKFNCCSRFRGVFSPTVEVQLLINFTINQTWDSRRYGENLARALVQPVKPKIKISTNQV
jgi:hypothetical protein